MRLAQASLFDPAEEQHQRSQPDAGVSGLPGAGAAPRGIDVPADLRHRKDWPWPNPPTTPEDAVSWTADPPGTEQKERAPVQRAREKLDPVGPPSDGQLFNCRRYGLPKPATAGHANGLIRRELLRRRRGFATYSQRMWLWVWGGIDPWEGEIYCYAAEALALEMIRVGRRLSAEEIEFVKAGYVAKAEPGERG